MRKVVFILLSIFLFNLPLLAEEGVITEWIKKYNGIASYWDRVYAMVLDNSDNIYVTGSSYGIYATIKYYPNSNIAWERIYFGRETVMEYAYDVAVDSSGNVYVTGTAGTIKYDSSGNEKWIGQWGGKAIAIDNYGNVYLIYGSATIKYYPDGDTAWVRSLNGTWYNYYSFNDIAVDSSGNVYVTGVHFERINNFESYLWCATIKYDCNGNPCWEREPSGRGYAITLDNSSNVYVTGSLGTIKYTPNGKLLWGRTWGGVAIALDDSGNVYVTGSGGGDYVTTKYYPDGDTAWVRRYNGPANSGDIASAIAVDSFRNVYVTGYSKGNGTDYDYATIKYLPNGDTVWTVRYNGPADSSDYANSIVVDSSGNVYVSGYSYVGVGIYDDYTTIKYVQFFRGDSNGDRKVSLSDIVYLINYLFKEGTAPVPIQSGDVNCDGKVILSDVIYLINYLFKSGPAPEC